MEAIAAYEEFKKIHPTHEEMPYVQYQIGMSHFSQMESLDRDQTPTRKALSSFEYLIANYPPSLFTERAKEKIGICKKRLAEQEFYIGKYYYDRGRFLAAARRFEGSLELYPKVGQEDRTLFLLGKSYLEMNQPEMAKRAFTRLVTDYPRSSYAREAKSILDKAIKSKESFNELPKGDMQVNVVLIRFEEEGRRPLSFSYVHTPLPVPPVALVSDSPKKQTLSKAPDSPKKEIPPKTVPDSAKKESPSNTGSDSPKKQTQSKTVPSSTKNAGPSRSAPDSPKKEIKETKREESPDGPLKMAFIPDQEGRKGIPLKTTPVEEKPAPSHATRQTEPAPSPASRQTVKWLPGDLNREKIEPGQPIDITSDKVESYTKENLIVFKGNVTARQKDIVIYADSIEASIIENGKGIEKVVADGNVKVQQGLRVANCEKAIFYNVDKKVILTGNPSVWDGGNMISGEEIIFDIEQDRVDVKGGPGGRGKAKVHP